MEIEKVKLQKKHKANVMLLCKVMFDAAFENDCIPIWVEFISHCGYVELRGHDLERVGSVPINIFNENYNYSKITPAEVYEKNLSMINTMIKYIKENKNRIWKPNV